MQWQEEWQGLPYFPISSFYRRVFGGKVYKIPVSTAQTCPNREGLKGMKTCIFCDEWGSAAYPELRQLELRKQIEESKNRVQSRTHAEKFLVYFQAYTNTFSKTQKLREQFEVACQVDDVVGLVVGTRPDCISDAVIDLWQEYSKKIFISVELGAQSFNNAQLRWMERGHTAEKTMWAIDKIKSKVDVDLGIHLIFGLPEETDQQIIETARQVSRMPVNNVKLHNLHVLKNTPLESLYGDGEFTPLTMEEYARRVILFVQHLDPRVAIHRLAAVASREAELIAPEWTGHKMMVYQYFIDRFYAEKAYQGQYFSTSN